MEALFKLKFMIDLHKMQKNVSFQTLRLLIAQEISYKNKRA